MKLELTITLGNAAMTSGEDLALALREVANKLDLYGCTDMVKENGRIRDLNGNTVGTWRTKEE